MCHGKTTKISENELLKIHSVNPLWAPQSTLKVNALMTNKITKSLTQNKKLYYELHSL